jgi:integrase
MALIKQKSSGIWQIRFQLNGKKYQKSSKTKKKSVAQDIERTWRNELNEKHLLGKKDTISFYEALDMFLESKADMKTYHNISSNIATVKRYINDKPLHELSTRDIELFVQVRKREKKANQTIQHGIIQIRGAWKYANKMGYETSPIEFPKLKINNQRVKCLSRDEEQKLLDELSPDNPSYYSKLTPHKKRNQLKLQRQDNYDFTVILLDCGMRYGELAKMKWSQVDLINQTIHLKRTKTNNEFILMMTNRVQKILERRSQNKVSDTWVFTDKTGRKPRNHSTIAIRNAMQKIGLRDFRVHDLRHTLASRMIRNNCTIQETALVLGHSSLSTTMRYAHLSQSQVAMKMRDAINSYNDGH